MSLWVVALCVVVIGGAVKLLAVICRLDEHVRDAE
jgi:hypothetical protein